MRHRRAGQVVDIFVSPTRDTEAAVAFLCRVVRETGVRPHTVTTDKAAIYPPTLAEVLPGAEHDTGKIDQQAIARDRGDLQGRYRPMRSFKQARCAQVVCAGHGVMRNLRNGLCRLGCVWYGPGTHHPPRLLTAWDERTDTLCAA